MNDVFGPYHFVPLSKWVYQPDWAHLVSHDHPLERGLSGRIELTLKNDSPLCVGGARESGSNAVKWLRSPDGKPIIPATSIKGMLRSVLEIATFSKFQNVDNARFSYRDISPKSHYLDNVIGSSKVNAAWLKFNSDKQKWELRDAKYLKITHKDINQLLGTRIKNDMEAVDKYRQVPLTKTIHGKANESNTKLIEVNGKGLGVSGHAVFCNNRVKGKGTPESYEFSYFFYNEEEPKTYDSLVSLVEDFEFSHDEKQLNYLKANANPELGIPVFVLRDKRKGTLKSIGLAQMPRVGYQYSTEDLILAHSIWHRSEAMFDFSELIFGTIREQGLSLRSRVSFTDLLACSQVSMKEYSNLVLNSPKPTFQNAYLEARQGKADSYDNKGAVLSGWKRYIAKDIKPEEVIQKPENDNHNVRSSIETVQGGATFAGELYFHNLLPEELGALLWALQLGNSNETVHLMGHGKPLGFGRIRIQSKLDIIQPNDESVDHAEDSLDPEYFINSFVNLMNDKHPSTASTSWEESPQIQYLRMLASPDKNSDLQTRYMSLKEEFANIKKDSNKPTLKSLHNIGRAEGILDRDAMVSTSFGRGRLSSLLDSFDDQDQQTSATYREQAEKAKQKLTRAKKEAEKQLELESLTALEIEWKHVRERIAAFALAHEDQNIRTALKEFLLIANSRSDEVTPPLKEEVLKTAKGCDFKNKPKKRKEEHKQILQEFGAL